MKSIILIALATMLTVANAEAHPMECVETDSCPEWFGEPGRGHRYKFPGT